MNEKKKGFIILAVIGVFLLLLIIIGVIQNKNKLEVHNADIVRNLYHI